MPDMFQTTPAEDFKTLNRYCVQYMQQNIPSHYAVPAILTLILDLAKVCVLIGKPEGIIQTTSPLYTERETNERTFRDMTDETVQELTQLPRYQAYAKIIDDIQDRQIVRTHRIETLPLPAKQSMETEVHAIANGHTLCKDRNAIEKEIRARQSRWRGGHGSPRTRERE